MVDLNREKFFADDGVVRESCGGRGLSNGVAKNGSFLPKDFLPERTDIGVCFTVDFNLTEGVTN